MFNFTRTCCIKPRNKLSKSFHTRYVQYSVCGSITHSSDHMCQYPPIPIEPHCSCFVHVYSPIDKFRDIEYDVQYGH